ncbi:Transcriptional activator ARO80 [Phlyctema vagabunda]|uniref:Transcriptional activator ARO80 n=1 Tax=Phlyctema vagabunda TaxID=108571 RepID=A0ABR4PIR3_9HELO
MGSVDDPRDPPCVRCRRESKECYFSATRRKRKTDDGRDESLDGHEFGDDYVTRNGRKNVHPSASPVASGRQSSMGAPASARSTAPYPDNTPLSGPPLTPGGSIGRREPLRRPNQASPEAHNSRGRDESNADESNTQLENFEAQQVMRERVYGPHEALDLLYKAATDIPNLRKSESDNHMSPVLNHTPKLHARPQESPFESRNVQNPPVRQEAAIDPALSEAQPEPARDQGYKDALKAWARFRFVRAGWFTPSEAIDYIEYYYEYLSPLTPISPPTFRHPGTHPTLLTEEPILTVTLLTIATRYRTIPGPGGHCRSHAIHEQLWTYLRGMIERCLWGQEAFGGGFCGSGSGAGLDPESQTSSTAPWRGMRKGSLRTLGTIESLMILTEWHPRALHFPPTEATDELMLPSYEVSDTYSVSNDDEHRLPGGVGGKRIESWLEPAWRSDRMCWMLLSTAMGLSYELGVFDDIDELLDAGGEMTRPEYEDEPYRVRAARIKRLLLIYVTQLAGRLGWTNMVPENLRSSDPAFAPRKRRASVDGRTPDTNISSANNFNYIPDLELDDQIIYCWAGISNAMRIGNEKLFRSRQYTTKIIQDGTYLDLLKDFQPMLSRWNQEFQRFRIPTYIRHILSIEYEYVRIYVNSLSLQAVIERCTNNAGNHANTVDATGAAAAHGHPLPLSPETQNYYGKLPLARIGGFSPADQGYVKEVVDGSRNLLRTVVDGLLPGGFLKHAPVRTYFRIISGAMFLLKTFTLGASKSDVQISISLMDSAVDALRNCVVDDVHLGIRFADLLENLTSRLRSRFISAPTGPAPGSDDAENIRSPGVHQDQEPDRKRQRIDNREQVREWNAGTPSYNVTNGGVDSNVAGPSFDITQGNLYGSSYGHASGPLFGGDLNNQFLAGNNDWEASGNELWYLPAGPAFFQNMSDQMITQTAEGVNVGGMDLLDYTLGDTFAGLDAAGF